MQLQHAADGPAPTARQQQVERDDRDGEDDADQALGQHAQRAAGGKGVAVQPRVLRLRAPNPSEQARREPRARSAQDDSLGGGFFGRPEAEHRQREPEAEHRVGDEDAGEEKNAGRREQDQPGIQSGARRAKCPPRERLDREGQREHGERERDACGNRQCPRGAVAQQLHPAHRRGHRPIEQRRFLEIPDAVGVERDPVVAQQHLARDLGVHRVGVVQQRGTDEGEARVERDPQGSQQQRSRERALRNAFLRHIATIFESERLNTDRHRLNRSKT